MGQGGVWLWWGASPELCWLWVGADPQRESELTKIFMISDPKIAEKRCFRQKSVNFGPNIEHFLAKAVVGSRHCLRPATELHLK